MCLTVKNRNKPKAKKNGRVNVYKVVAIDDDKNLSSPVYGDLISNGWFKASGTLLTTDEVINGGAIHCLSSLKLAKQHWTYHEDKKYRRIIKCEAFISDFMANGHNGEVAYKKIYVSKKEIAKAIKSK